MAEEPSRPRHIAVTQSDQPGKFERQVERYGLPIVYLGITISVMVSVALWAKPKFDKAFDKHMEFLDTVSKTTQQQADNQKLQVENQRQIIEQTTKLTTIAEKQEFRIEDIHRAIVGNGKKPVEAKEEKEPE